MRMAAIRAWTIRSAAAVALVGAALLTLDRIFPPDLARYHDRSAMVLDADGRVLRAFTAHDGKWRLHAGPGDVDPLYLKMLIAYEDKRFNHHVGIDPLAVGRATWQLVGSGRIVSGASTLTMQAARLLEPHERSLGGKLQEMARALQLELRYSKREILTIYLTLAPFGGNLEGVRAASLAYFGKEPAKLEPAEAALLVALPQSPERRRPDLRAASARGARDQTIKRLEASGVITARQAPTALTRTIPETRVAMPFLAPHLTQQLAGAAPAGATLRTTVKRDLQEALERLARAESQATGDNANIALFAIDNRTHQVLAYVGGADFFSGTGQNDLVRARRSPGSTLKPFVYGLGLDDGFIHPATLIDDEPMRFGDWAPRNFDRDSQGTVTIRQALQQSLNLPAVAILTRVGSARFTATLQQAGATLTFPKEALPGGNLAVILGGVGINLHDLVGLYSGLANGGMVSMPVMLAGAKPATPRRMISPASAWQITDILRGSSPPPGWAPLSAMEARRRIAFKTGTSYGFRDAWAVGYSPSYTIGVWVGHANGAPRPGQYGRITALPALLKAFDLMPPEAGRPDRPPADTLRVSHNGQLPLRLQRFTLNPVEMAVVGQGDHIGRPHIVFPPDGATIDLRGRSHQSRQLPLKAEGGAMPLTWVVDDRPLPRRQERGDTLWAPDGNGFTRITVIDALGRSASVRVRLQGSAH